MFDIEKFKERLDEVSKQQLEEKYEVHIPAEGTGEGRVHLGMSQIGKECERALFFSFRKFQSREIGGRLARLFRRGHREEYYIADLLEKCGLKVWTVDENGGQFRVNDIEGHFAGSVDGVSKDPAKEFIDTTEPFLLEFKTYNDTRYKKLCTLGVELSDPTYYIQQVSYLSYMPEMIGTLFIAVNKNNDDMEVQWIKPNPSRAKRVAAKAEDIINARRVPAPFTSKSSHYICKMCDFRGVCWEGQPADKHCKTCKHSYACADKQWCCEVAEFGEVCDKYEQVK